MAIVGDRSYHGPSVSVDVGRLGKAYDSLQSHTSTFVIIASGFNQHEFKRHCKSRCRVKTTVAVRGDFDNRGKLVWYPV